jgi:Fe-S-cluster containining protein
LQCVNKRTKKTTHAAFVRSEEPMKKAAPGSANAPPAFACRMCGICCRGEGGIVVGPRDMSRLCALLRMDAEAFVAGYAYVQGGKTRIRSGPDGYCVFFVSGAGCSVHAAKPDVCRAWPFFRGNLLDKGSLAMAKAFCPGIDPDIEHADFVREGLRYLEKHAIGASNPAREANALRRVLP